MQAHTRSDGFNKLKLSLIVMGVLVVILVGGLIVRAVTATPSNEDTADTSVGPEGVSVQPGDISDYVQRFYDQYIAAPTDGATVADTQQAALNGFGSENAINNFIGHEKQCVQNIPASVTVGSVTSLDKPYKVNVSYIYTEQADPVNVTVTVTNNQSGLLIDDISCS